MGGVAAGLQSKTGWVKRQAARMLRASARHNAPGTSFHITLRRP